jgi:GNAT superfamily N-acetyltransferase
VAELELGRYSPEDSDEALALDASCPQGGALRLSFRRPSFHRRADRYPEQAIFTARLDGRLLGTLAVAAKPACWRGRAARAAFAFDLRVAPRARGQGIATRLAREGLAWARARADLVYAYTVDENRAAARVSGLMGLVDAGRYAYLVCPVVALARRGAGPAGERGAQAVSHAEALAAFVAGAGPFDLASALELRAGDEGYVGSWRIRGGDGVAVASAFSHASTLAEVVERVPPALRALRALSGAGLPWPRRWPRVPRDGEELRSWYVFDAFAEGPRVGLALARAIASQALARGVDWLYLVHARSEPWLAAVRAELPRPFAPLLGYRLLLRHFAEPAPAVRSFQVDVRDL